MTKESKPIELMEVYYALFSAYGAQGWWPVTPIGGCGCSSGKNNPDDIKPIYGIGLKNEKQKLEIMVGAILTQNTQWKPNVENAIMNLNRNGLIDIRKLMGAKHDRLAGLIKSSGYFNQKAIKLKSLAEFLSRNPIKKLEKMPTWELRKVLLEIRGIGPETADSIILYAFNKPVFVVDTYTKRLFSRLGLTGEDASYDEVQEYAMKNLPADAKLFNEFHALIVEHAKQHCKKTPVCKGCSLPGDCRQKKRI